jgi:hypothetical protein
MAIPTGTFTLGPADGTLSVHTGKTGAAAKAGHNLRIEVRRWSATITLAEDPADSTMQLSADSRSLSVLEGTGGMSSLDEDDRSGITQTIDEEVLKGTTIAFHSVSVTASPAGGGLRVEGELELAGSVAPIGFELTVGEDHRISARTVVTQTQWGMKPYSALFGTLKVHDDVEVALDAHLSSTPMTTNQETTHG